MQGQKLDQKVMRGNSFKILVSDVNDKCNFHILQCPSWQNLLHDIEQARIQGLCEANKMHFCTEHH